MFVIDGCSSCDLCFLIRTNTCVMKYPVPGSQIVGKTRKCRAGKNGGRAGKKGKGREREPAIISFTTLFRPFSAPLR